VIEQALINSARQRARLDLMGVMVMQLQINLAVARAIRDAAGGKRPNLDSLRQIETANDALAVKVNEWLAEGETFFT
jgi:hypothetical protein